MTRIATIAVLAMMALTAAAAETADTLVGRWMLINQASALQIEFETDGTYRARTTSGAIKGKWARVDDQHLATWTSEDSPRRVNKFHINGLNLIIIDAAGTHHVHRRDVLYTPAKH